MSAPSTHAAIEGRRGPAPTADEVQAISDWLVERGLAKTGLEPLVVGFCERLVAVRLPLWRGHVAMRTLHPSIDSVAITWHRDAALEVRSIPREDAEAATEWLNSPLYHMIETGRKALRRRLIGADATRDFPYLEELRAEGGTDYYGRIVPFTVASIEDRLTGVVSSWTSDAGNGFSDADIAVLDRLAPRLALSLKVALADQIAANLLDTYVGPSVGRRVLGGEIARGAMDVIPAVIFHADLRDFTAASGHMAPNDVTEMLNAYFECMVEPVTARGGQILKFLGDGLLATFEVDGATEAARCDTALGAAREALARVDALNRRRRAAEKPALGLDLVLHLGDVLYGNVGAADRLDFTMVGPAVNEASRIEGLCTELGVNLVLSESFAAIVAASGGRLRSLGHHRLRGVGAAQELFTVADAPCPPRDAAEDGT